MERCKNGHVLDEGNTALCCDGHGRLFRRCRLCNIERAKRWRLNNADWIRDYKADYKTNYQGGKHGKEHSSQG